MSIVNYNCTFTKEIMMKMVSAFLFIIIFLTGASAQESQIKGKITDTSAHETIHEASVLLLHAKDSLLITDMRSNKDGNFTFNDIKKGKYILLITHPKYVDYVEYFTIDSLHTNTSFNKISLTQKAILLKEVIVNFKKRPAIRFKGDTIEFAADSFHVQPNASVEDLLKRLPGLEVDKDGKITAQGKTIEKVLVDGEEFFGDDPTLVTKNLRANMVDKVQLYDKTSDQAAFTGINDGQKTKTLNLKLKEDKKQSYFGKIELGGGSDGFYQNQALFNLFQGKEKIAGYFTMSNTGKIGLDRRSQQSYAGGDSNPIANDLDNWNGTYQGIGIPRSISGGLHFDNKWDNDKKSLNVNYKLGDLDVSGQQNSITQINLPGNVLYSTSNQKTKNDLLRHGLNIASNVKLDSTSELKFYMEGSLLNKTINENDSSDTRRENLSLLNSSRKNISTTGHTKAFNSNILWQKKFDKQRRTLSINFNARLNNDNNTGFFYTKSSFFDNIGRLDSSQIVDQYKKADNHSELYGLKFTYTEPLSKWGSIVVNYGAFIDNAKAELQTFNKSTGGISGTLDSLYSSNYKFNQLSNKGGAAYIYNRQKVRFQFGSDIAFDMFNQHNLFNNTALKRDFTNWYPNAQFQFQFSPTKTISFNYDGNTTQPTILQLQPILNNIDPLNVFVGNIALKPAFNNNFLMSYQFIKNFTYLGINGSFSFTDNPLTLSTQTDGSSGKSTNTYVNLPVRKTLNYSANFLYRTQLKLWNLDFGIDGIMDGKKYASISNGSINISNSSTYRFDVVFSKAKVALYNIGASFGPNYNVNNSSLQPLINNSSWGYMINPFLDFYLPAGLQIHTDGNYTWQGKTQTFNSNFSRFILNAWIGKQILSEKNLLFKLSANDILNQNLGFNRSAYNNVITQNSFTTIARYFMVSIVWDFNHTGKKTQ